MVSLVCMILYLCDICGFSWWVVLIESVLALVLSYLYSQKCDDDFIPNLIVTLSLGVAYFSIMKLFCGLTISAWWLLISPIYAILALFIPGGFIGTELIFKHFGLISQTPLWTLIVAGIMDIIFIIVLIAIIIETIKDKYSNK